jgi:hypothetical protein
MTTAICHNRQETRAFAAPQVKSHPPTCSGACRCHHCYFYCGCYCCDCSGCSQSCLNGSCCGSVLACRRRAARFQPSAAPPAARQLAVVTGAAERAMAEGAAEGAAAADPRKMPLCPRSKEAPARRPQRQQCEQAGRRLPPLTAAAAALAVSAPKSLPGLIATPLRQRLLQNLQTPQQQPREGQRASAALSKEEWTRAQPQAGQRAPAAPRAGQLVSAATQAAPRALQWTGGAPCAELRTQAKSRLRVKLQAGFLQCHLQRRQLQRCRGAGNTSEASHLRAEPRLVAGYVSGKARLAINPPCLLPPGRRE